MKKLIQVQFILFVSLIVLLIFSCFSVQAQQIVEYDFNNNKLINEDQNAKNGEFINFKVLDVNPFLYEVKITSHENEYNITVPVLFKKCLIDFSESGLEIQTLSGETDEEAYNSFINAVKRYNEFVSVYQKLLSIVYTDGLPIKKIIEKKNDITNVEFDDLLITSIENNIKEINTIHNESNYGKIDNIYEKLKDADFENLPNDMNKLLNKINVKSFSFSTSPLVAETDEIVYEITITPIKNENMEKYGSGSRKVYFEVPVDVLGGFKIDFSTGLFFSNLIDHKFATLKDSIVSASDTLKGYRILRNKEGDFKLGLSATAHIYYRFSSIFNIGFNFGVGIIPDQSISYLLGGSFIFGKKKRVILNGGITAGSVDRLSSLVKENNFYSDIPLEGGLTVKELRFGWYLGISYNLTE